MKEKNNVFIGLAIFISFILLAAAVILIPVIKGMNPDWKAILVTGRKNLDTDSQISQNPLPLKSEEVISFSGFNELSITLKPGGQNKKTMVLSLKDGNWLDLENPDLDISQEKVSVILEELNNIKVLNRINNAKDNELKSFGFDYPRIQVQGKSNGNKIFGFKIGNIVPSGYNCYLKIDGETPVYIADGMILSMLEMTEESLQDNTAFNIPPEKEIKTIIVETPGKPTLTVNYDKEGRGYLTCGKYTRPQKLSDTSKDSTLSGEELVKERLRNLEESLVRHQTFNGHARTQQVADIAVGLHIGGVQEIVQQHIVTDVSQVFGRKRVSSQQAYSQRGFPFVGGHGKKAGEGFMIAA